MVLKVLDLCTEKDLDEMTHRERVLRRLDHAQKC